MPAPSPPFSLTWQRRPRRPGTLELLGALGAGAAAAAVAWPHLPFLSSLWPPCAFREVTGFPCGACGATRAFVRLAHGEVADAIRVSPLGAAAFLAGLALAAVVLAGWIVPSLPRPVLQPRGRLGAWLVRWGLLTALLANWAYLLAYTALTGSPPP